MHETNTLHKKSPFGGVPIPSNDSNLLAFATVYAFPLPRKVSVYFLHLVDVKPFLLETALGYKPAKRLVRNVCRKY
jgi:hypothetical protein